MIISASRRTDIPAFYSKWFMNRIKAGYFFKVNPFNKEQVRGISLSPEDVDFIVFWTKYPKPLMKYLDELDALGYKYYFQYTLNAYPEIFEPELPDIKERIGLFKELSSSLSSKRVIWRYDPIIYSSITPVQFHLEKFEEIAAEINEYTFRVVISFLDIYGKTERRLKKLEQNKNIIVSDIVDYKDKLMFICERMKEIGARYKLEIRSCAEAGNLSTDYIKPGSCIDKELAERVFGIKLDVRKDKNQRKECLCVESEDMGIYDTCKFACTYCYAVNSLKAVENKALKHDPDSSILIGKCEKKFSSSA